MTAMADVQEGGGAEPGRHGLDVSPLLVVDEVQEVVFGAGALVLPEHAILTAETRAHTT